LSEKNSTDNELNTEKSNNKTDSDQKYKNIELKNTNMSKKQLLATTEKEKKNNTCST
ncbi:18420_t:CDS:1, partial [Gigaspora rosea]